MKKKKEKKPSKLRFFYFLLILTFLGSGLAIFQSIFKLFDWNFLDVFFENLPIYESLFVNKIENSLFFEILKMLLFSVNIFAAILLWKKLKPGLYIYMINQLVLLIIPFLFALDVPFMQVFSIAIPDVIFTVTFVLLYLLYAKDLRCPILGKKEVTEEA